MSTVRTDSTLPEVHAAKRETSVMLALAPDDVHLDSLGIYTQDDAQRDEIRYQILDRGTTQPWTSGDRRIATLGIIGDDPRLASAELGESIIASALEACARVLEEL
jgi:creatinine amidohydrolase